jgi:glyoxylase-like metal-dependent hydrolase (beta-lactamase superfamily II)
MAWRLPVPGGKPIVIDSGLTAADARAMEMEAYGPNTQARIERALGEAGLVLVTHEHPDHQGALVALGGLPLLQAARLNPGQTRSAPLAAKLAWLAGAAPTARITPGAPQAVAPGVVVIPAPSHTPGSQMIYVRLANGRELLFAGDIATFGQSWEETRARSRLVSEHFAPEDRHEVFAWLRTIRALRDSAPALIILPGHDPEWIGDPDHKVPVHRGFWTSGS